MEMLHAFGLDPVLLLANFVNFAILMFILHKLAYKPMLNFMHERQRKIAEGLKNAEEAKSMITDVEARKETMLSEARKEAQEILSTAKARAEAQAQATLEESHKEAEAVLQRAQEQATHEKEVMLKEAHSHITSTVILLAGKLLHKKMDNEADRAFVEEALAELKPRS